MRLRRAAVALALLSRRSCMAAIAIGASSTRPRKWSGSGKPTTTNSVCGLGTGKKATGTRSSSAPSSRCMPGHRLHGHPATWRRRTSTASTTTAASTAGRSSTSIETEQTQPRAGTPRSRGSWSRATKVVGMVGNTSIIECAVNREVLREQGHLHDRRRVSHPSATADVEPPRTGQHGPALQLDIGAAQYVDPEGRQRRSSFDQSNVPGTGYIKAGPTADRQGRQGSRSSRFEDTVPIQDANSVALKPCRRPGANGGVVLTSRPTRRS